MHLWLGYWATELTVIGPQSFVIGPALFARVRPCGEAASFAQLCSDGGARQPKVPRSPFTLSGRRHRRRGHERAMAHGRVALAARPVPARAESTPEYAPIVHRCQPFAPREALGAAAG